MPPHPPRLLSTRFRFVHLPPFCLPRLSPSPGEQLLPPDLLLSGQGLVPQGSGNRAAPWPVSIPSLWGQLRSRCLGAPASWQAVWSHRGSQAWPSCPVASVTKAEVGSRLGAPTMTAGRLVPHTRLSSPPWQFLDSLC